MSLPKFVEVDYAEIEARWEAMRKALATPEPHTCPYKREILDSDALCTCTPEQQQECADGI